MTLQELEVDVNRKKTFDFLINVFLCLISIFISFFFIYKFSSIDNFGFSVTIGIVFLILLIFSIIGIYALFGLFNPNEITYLKNELDKEDNLQLAKNVFDRLKGEDFKININSMEFVFQKSIWSYKYKVYLFAEDNLLAIFIKVISSNPKGAFFDFGGSKRNQKRIVKILINQTEDFK